VIDPALASEAVATMMGERMATHGKPEDTLARIAQMWSGYIGADISVTDVAQMMVLLKIARARCGAGYDRDHYLDAIAYTLLAEGSAR
jgi:hypothetical protein